MVSNCPHCRTETDFLLQNDQLMDFYGNTYQIVSLVCQNCNTFLGVINSTKTT